MPCLGHSYPLPVEAVNQLSEQIRGLKRGHFKNFGSVVKRKEELVVSPSKCHTFAPGCVHSMPFDRL